MRRFLDYCKPYSKKILMVTLVILWLPGAARALTFRAAEEIGELTPEITLQWGDVSSEGEVVEYSWETSTEKLIFHSLPEGGQVPFLEHCGMTQIPGAPSLPVCSVKIPLPDGYQVTGATIVEGHYRFLEGRHSVAPSAEPYLWEPGAKKPVPREDPAIYEISRFCPGKLFELDQGQGADGSFAYLRIFPLQFRPPDGQLVLATDLRFQLITSRKLISCVESPGLAFYEPSLILCPDVLLSQAQRLADLHAFWGRPAKVLTMSEIKANYEPGGHPKHAGYKNPNLPYRNQIHGYDYELARRAVNMLLDEANHPHLESVTILGDSALVPPSRPRLR